MQRLFWSGKIYVKSSFKNSLLRSNKSFRNSIVFKNIPNVDILRFPILFKHIFIFICDDTKFTEHKMSSVKLIYGFSNIFLSLANTNWKHKTSEKLHCDIAKTLSVICSTSLHIKSRLFSHMMKWSGYK